MLDYFVAWLLRCYSCVFVLAHVVGFRPLSALQPNTIFRYGHMRVVEVLLGTPDVEVDKLNQGSCI